MASPNRTRQEVLIGAPLPAEPRVLLRLLDLLDQPDPDPVQLARWVALEPTISLHLARLASETLNGRARASGPTHWLNKAGVASLRGLTQALAGARLFARLRGEPALSFTHAWRHACRAAHAARALADATGYRWPEEAWLGGLLHDIGVHSIGVQYPAEYSALLAEGHTSEQRMPLERERFGRSHAEVGALLVGRLAGFSFLADAVQYHQEPAAALMDAHPLARIVAVAHGLAAEGPAEVDAGVEAAEMLLGLTPEQAAPIAQAARAAVEAVDEELGRDPDRTEAPDYTPEPAAGALEQIDAEIVGRVESAALADVVRGLMQGLDSEEGLLAAALQAAGLMFGAHKGACFLLDAGQGRLVGQGAGSAAATALSELSLSAGHEDSLIAEALRSGTMQVSKRPGRDPAVVVDAEVAGLLGAERLVALPLVTELRRIGVLVLGADAVQAARWEGERQGLGALARGLAETLGAVRLRAQREARRVDDGLAEVESQARRIAHEANNPLGVLRNYISIVAGKVDGDHPAQEDLRIMREEITRVAEIVSQLGAIAETRTPSGPADLNALVKDLLRVFEDSLLKPRGLSVSLELDASLPPVVSDRDALKQVLINLIKNAAEAMQEGGRLTVLTQDYVYFNEREYVELEVRDDGPGIPPHVLARLFEPIESSKGAGHSGLGLSIVKSLVAQLGGVVSCKSSERRGTTFRILLPREIET